AGASSATLAFLRLRALTGEDEFGRIAEAHLRRQGQAMAENPFSFGHLLCAAVLHARGITEVAVLGPPGPKRDSLLAASREGFRPDILAYASERGAGPAMAGRGGADGEPAAWVCRQFACERPRTDPDELRAALHASAGVSTPRRSPRGCKRAASLGLPGRLRGRLRQAGVLRAARGAVEARLHRPVRGQSRGSGLALCRLPRQHPLRRDRGRSVPDRLRGRGRGGGL